MPKRKNKSKVYFVDLPEKDTNVYISVLFSYGYYNEPQNKFGTGHLLEHYLGFRIDDKIGRPIQSASISNRSMQFDIKSTKGKFLNELRDALTTLKDDPIDNSDFLKREKARIKIEIDEMYAQNERFLEQQALASLYSGPDIVTRNKAIQSKIVQSIKIENLRALRDELFRHNIIGVVIGAHKLPKSKRLVAEQLIGNFIKTTGAIVESPKPVTKIAKITKKVVAHHGVEPDYIHIAMMWPGLSLKNHSAERFAMRFICSQLLERLEKPLGDIGIYKYDYQYVIANSFGYVRFHAYIPKDASAQFEKIVYQQLKELSSDKKNLAPKLKKFVSIRTKKLKEMWDDNLGRMDWVIDDLIDYGKIISYKEVIEQRKKINLPLVSRLLGRIFQKKYQHSLVVKSSRG